MTDWLGLAGNILECRGLFKIAGNMWQKFEVAMLHGIVYTFPVTEATVPISDGVSVTSGGHMPVGYAMAPSF